MSCKDRPCGQGPTIRQAVHGAKEIAKTRLGIGVATQQVINDRIRICTLCPDATDHPTRKGAKSKCRICHCYLAEKVRRAAEKCPKEKWGPE